jgi:transcriptional regulator with XRE-family HTH domain
MRLGQGAAIGATCYKSQGCTVTKHPRARSAPHLTLRDVSEASGVSEMTVSRVLRNRGDVSETTRERVLEAARNLGYVPNKIAGALASQRVNLVGVIIPSLSNMVFPEVMTGISEVLEDTGLQPVVGVSNYLPEREEQVIYEMLSWRPSGLILAGAGTQRTRPCHAAAGRAFPSSRSWISTANPSTAPSASRTACRPRDGRGDRGRRLPPHRLSWAPICPRWTTAPANGWKGSRRRWRARGWRSSTANIISGGSGAFDLHLGWSGRAKAPR